MAAFTGDARALVTRWRALRRDHVPDIGGQRIVVAASFTAQPIEPSLGVAFHESSGRVPTIAFADYNQIFQVCLDPESHGITDGDDVVVLWRLEDVLERDVHAWGEGDATATDRLLEGAHSLGAAVAQLTPTIASAVVSDCPTPVGYGFDHDDPELLTRLVELQAAANRAFDDGLGATTADRLRLGALQHAAGTTPSFDRRTWLMHRQPYTEAFVMRLGASIADVMAARTRVPPKVVVLDCDDTLWSGVIADDGIGGLQCSDAFPGFAHRSFQVALRRLRHQGVLLALASKNDAENVERAFAEVDGMVLTDDDIAARRVSWDPKPQGVVELADELNLGLDSFVFVDDSDYEIGAMRTQLPAVRSLRVPERLEALPDLLAETGWFRSMRVTDDDRERTARMLAESGRSQAATAMSHGEFLAALELHVTLLRVGPAELGRVTQLVNKTNQFNVTTLRRSEGEVARLADDPEAGVYGVAVHDRFGEYGIVGVVVAVPGHDGPGAATAWHLDTVLMSCRVLGRGVETAMLAGVVAELRARRPGDVSAQWIDSGRNQLVADLFPRHGFDETGAGVFVLAADHPIDVPDHITLVTP